ncbi:MAG: hypothetical protein ABIS51_18640 [Sphingomonas sp.]
MRYLFMIGSALLLSGCASTITAYAERSTRKEAVVDGANKKIPPVAGVSINSTRRLILSKDKARSPYNYYTCSEPAPDTALNEALQTALSASAKTKGTEASGNFSDTVVLSNIILSQRTELVEMWRTISFQYCEFRMNGDDQAAEAYLNAATAALSRVGMSAANAVEARNADQAHALALAQAQAAKIETPNIAGAGETTKPVEPVHAGAATSAPKPSPTPTP